MYKVSSLEESELEIEVRKIVENHQDIHNKDLVCYAIVDDAVRKLKKSKALLNKLVHNVLKELRLKCKN